MDSNNQEERFISDSKTICQRTLFALVGLTLLLVSLYFLAKPPPFELNVPGLEKTMQTQHRALRNELRAMNRENGFVEFYPEKNLENQPPEMLRLREMQNLPEMREVRNLLDRIRQGYLQFLNEQSIYRKYELASITYYFDFMHRHPGLQRELMNSNDTAHKLAELSRFLAKEKKVIRIPRQTEDPAPATAAPEKALSNKKVVDTELHLNFLLEHFRFALLRHDYPAAVDYLSASFRYARILSAPARPMVRVILAMKSALYLNDWTREDIARMNQILKSVPLYLIQQRQLITQLSFILGNFERARLNGVRLFLKKPPIMTDLYDSVRELDKTAFQRGIKTAVRDYFYDIDVDELVSLKLQRAQLSGKLMPYWQYPAQRFPENSPYEISALYEDYRRNDALLLSNLQAAVESMRIVFSNELREPYEGNTVNPIDNTPYRYEVTSYGVISFTGNETGEEDSRYLDVFREGFRLQQFMNRRNREDAPVKGPRRPIP